MQDILFTGTFKNLIKGHGYKFQKLYASNHKVYSKDIGRGNTFWVWVAKGGYVELNDLYDNTLNIINALKTIDWKTVKAQTVFGNTCKNVYIRFNHDDPSKGYKYSDMSLSLEISLYFRNLLDERGVTWKELKTKDRKEYDRLYEYACGKVYNGYNREFRVDEERCKIILDAYNELQNS